LLAWSLFFGCIAGVLRMKKSVHEYARILQMYSVARSRLLTNV
jgi:hypothetical protein